MKYHLNCGKEFRGFYTRPLPGVGMLDGVMEYHRFCLHCMHEIEVKEDSKGNLVWVSSPIERVEK